MDRTLKGIAAANYGNGRVYLDFNFQTNNASSPLLSTVVGVTTGTATAGQAPPPVVASITRTGVGVLVVQLSNADTFNKVIYVSAELDDTPNDGAYCTCKAVTNEGTSTGIAFTISTRAGATTTLTDYTGRKVSVSAILRNTAAAP
jgi:hypothetical protein